jgi:DNA-binding response OmpR family regulator
MHQRRFHVLVADERPESLHFTVDLLKRRDHVVAGASNMDDVHWWLSGWPIDLLIVSPEFAGGSGGQLAHEARGVQPEMAALLVDPERREPSAPEAARRGIDLVHHRVDSEEFAQAVGSILGRVTRRPRWPRKEIAHSVTMRIGDSVARLVDVSYGGLKFELTDENVLRSPVELDFPRADLRVSAEVIWSARPVPGRACVFGASVGVPPTDATEWRAFVDRIS